MTDDNGPRLLSGRYLLLDRLGSGGMGTVWRATDQVLERTVAVKEMHLRATGKDLAKQAARARREAHTLARISHPNVVNIHDLAEQDERWWLVMEFVDGRSLKEHVAADGPLGPSAVAGIGLQLLSALETVHAAGALHRDIKPGNVLMRHDDRVVLCDFGIAALTGTDSLTATGAVVGSLGYIAPERLRDRLAGPPSDLFSLGITLCELLSGRSPFDRPAAAGVLNAILHEKPNIPAAAGPLRAPLEAMLQKDPAERPSSAEASEMLRSLITTAPAAQPSPTGTQRIGAVPGRRRLGLAAFSAAVLLAAVVTAGALMSRPGEGTGTDATGTDAAGTGAAGADAAGTAGPATPSTGPDPAATGPARIEAVLPVPGVPDPDAPGSYWMFSNGRYIRAQISDSGHPVRQRLTPSTPLAAWDDTFQNLPGFRKRIDAALRVPGSGSDYWVFSASRYIRIRVAGPDAGFEDTLVAGPRPLGDWRNAFGDLPGDGIDAVMPTPDDPTQYWVFAGDRYVRTRLNADEPGGHLTYGPARLARWTGTLNRFPAFRKEVDAVMPVPGERNDYWVFSRARYMKIRVTDGAYKDTVLEGPEPFEP